MSADNAPFLIRERGITSGLREVYVNETGRQWLFTAKIFLIVSFQLLATAAVATSVLNITSAANFFRSTWLGLILFIFIIGVAVIDLICLLWNETNRGLNFFLLMVFIVALGSALGLSCVFYKYGNVAQQTFIVATAAFAGLALYAFLGPITKAKHSWVIDILWSIILIIGLFVLSQTCHFWPWLLLGGLNFNEVTVGASAAIAFCVYVAWDLNDMFTTQKQRSSVRGSMLLYVDIIFKFRPLVEKIYIAVSGK